MDWNFPIPLDHAARVDAENFGHPRIENPGRKTRDFRKLTDSLNGDFFPPLANGASGDVEFLGDPTHPTSLFQDEREQGRFWRCHLIRHIASLSEKCK